jgi:hypothetical protein
MQALVAGTSFLSTSSNVINEFGEVYAVRKIRNSRRRRLLEIVHSARALDTALLGFITHYNCLPKGQTKLPTTLGGYLIALKEHKNASIGQLTEAQTLHFQAQIVNQRNIYMHQAFTFPGTDQAVFILIAEMHSCLTVVLAL